MRRLWRRFGAAMATIYIAPDMQADEIELSFSPESIPFNLYFPLAVEVVELGLGFRQWNSYNYKMVIADSFSFINQVKEGEVISPGTFTGGFLVDLLA